MKLSVYNLKGVVYEGDVSSLTAKTAAGEITILDHHRPLISILKKGEMVIADRSGKRTVVAASSGFLEVRPRNEVSVIIG